MASIPEILSKIHEQPYPHQASNLRERVVARLDGLRSEGSRTSYRIVNLDRIGPTIQHIVQLMGPKEPVDVLTQREAWLEALNLEKVPIPVTFEFDLGRDTNYQGKIGFYGVNVRLDPTQVPAAIHTVEISTKGPIGQSDEVSLQITPQPNATFDPSRKADVKARTAAIFGLAEQNDPLLNLWIIDQLSKVQSGELEPPKIVNRLQDDYVVDPGQLSAWGVQPNSNLPHGGTGRLAVIGSNGQIIHYPPTPRNPRTQQP